MTAENSRFSLKDALQIVLFITGFVGTIVTSILQIRGWVQETQTFRIFSIALFVLFCVSIVWFVYNAQMRQKWTRMWGGIVFLYIVSMGFSIWVGTWIEPHVSSCADYDIRITSPLDGAHVQGGAIDVQGTYQGDLSDDSIVIIVSLPDGTHNWPSLAPVQIDPILGRWKGTAYLGGDPPQTYHISVALVGRSGRALLMYFAKVGRDTGQWPSIEVLPDDIQVCDYVLVEKK